MLPSNIAMHTQVYKTVNGIAQGGILHDYPKCCLIVAEPFHNNN